MLDPDALTIGFARRFATYKRGDLVFRDTARLAALLSAADRPVQFIFAGKAHPKDNGGKELIARVVQMARLPEFRRHIVFLEDYDMNVARHMVHGVDVWLNNPRRPLEASGTSGMKVAVNGGLNMSILDGWWVEGHIEGITGWSIGRGPSDAASQEGRDAQDARELYDKLRGVITPLFYQSHERWSELMRSTITFNASFFNTHRMVQQYAANAYV